MTHGPLNFHNLSLKIIVFLLCVIVFLITFKIDAKNPSNDGITSKSQSSVNTNYVIRE
jgi:hypothetical protein